MSFNSVMINDHIERATQLEMDFCTAYESAADASYKHKKENLGAGETIPEGGRIFEPGERADFERVAADFHGMISGELDKAESYVNTAITAAPSQEAVNYITTLSMRSNVSESELRAALDKYGENFASYQAIKDVAERNKVYLPSSPIEDAKDQIAQKRRELDCINLSGIEGGRISKNALLFAQALKGN